MSSSKPIGLSLGEARDLLRGAELRCTSCRVAVLQQLSKALKPLSHAEVADLLVPAGFDKTTIYRCLIEISEAGLVARLDLGDHVWRFELLRDFEKPHVEHPHFMCVDCGNVECLPNIDVTFSPSQRGRKKRIGEVTEVLLKGHCLNCS